MSGGADKNSTKTKFLATKTPPTYFHNHSRVKFSDLLAAILKIFPDFWRAEISINFKFSVYVFKLYHVVTVLISVAACRLHEASADLPVSFLPILGQL